MTKLLVLATVGLCMAFPSISQARKPWDFGAKCTAKTTIYRTGEVITGQGKGESSRRRKAVRRAQARAVTNCKSKVQRIGDNRGFRQRRINFIANRCEVRRRCRVKKPFIRFNFRF